MQQFLSLATACCELTRTRNCYVIKEYKVYLPQSLEISTNLMKNIHLTHIRGRSAHPTHPVHTVVSEKHRSLLYENNGLSYYENTNSVRSPAIKLEVNMGTFYYSSSNVTAVDNKFASYHQYLGYSHKCGIIPLTI